MKRSILLLVVVATALVSTGTSLADSGSSSATPCAGAWNVSGDWIIVFKLTGDPTQFPHNATLKQAGTVVAGNGGYPATGPPYAYAWSITSGNVSGDTINLTMDYTVGAVGTTMHMTGTVASDGAMSGTWDDNLAGTRTGDWATTSGAAECSSGDVAPPVLTAPFDVVADATTPAGANVTYAITATDDVDGPVPVTCSPPSGSFFLIGDAQVACKATDTAGNSAEASFNVHVNGAAEQLVNLMAAVAELSPPATRQIKVGLNFMLKRAQQSLAVNDTRVACTSLGTFVRLVYDALMQPGPKLSVSEAQAIIFGARRIRAVMGC